jgi:hypothetical protein
MATKPTKQQMAQAKARAGGNDPMKFKVSKKQAKDLVLNAAMFVGPGKFVKGVELAAKAARVVGLKKEVEVAKAARQLRANAHQRQRTRQANALSDVNPNTATAAKKTAPTSGPKFLGKLPEQTGKPSTRRPLKGQTLGAGHLTPRIKPKPEVTHAAIPSGRLSVPSSHAPRPPGPKASDTGAAPSKTKRTREIVLKPGQNTGKPSRVVTHVQAHKVTKSEVGRSPYGRLPDVSRLTPKPPKVEAAEVVVRSTGRKPLTKEQLAKKAQGIAKTRTKRVFKGLRGRGR